MLQKISGSEKMGKFNSSDYIKLIDDKHKVVFTPK